MNRWLSLSRALGIAMLVVAVAACSSDDAEVAGVEQPAPVIGPQKVSAKPGSVRDFALNVGDRVFFAVDQSTLTEPAMETLRRQAAWLKMYPGVRVQIEGHADERGTREYNLALGGRRSSATKAYLVSLGVDPQRITTISYGKERPVALCDAESCWSQNRRAVTVITSGAAS